VRSKKEVRYIVSRPKNPDDLEGEREIVGCYPYLELARHQADRTGPGTFVDAEGGTYHFDSYHVRPSGWEAEWTNRNLYQGKKKASHAG
jgi:hypothetical protein